MTVATAPVSARRGATRGTRPNRGPSLGRNVLRLADETRVAWVGRGKPPSFVSFNEWPEQTPLTPYTTNELAHSARPAVRREGPPSRAVQRCAQCLLAAVRALMSSVTPSQLYTVAPCRGRARF